MNTIQKAQHHVDEQVRQAHSSFYYAMRALPEDQRQAVFAIYAFCRELDDIVDGHYAADMKQNKLIQWWKEIENIYQLNKAEKLVGHALLPAIEQFDLPREEFDHLLEGMNMDGVGVMHAPEWKELARYCRCVAGSVGVLVLSVLGCTDRYAHQFALYLGEAMQLTNILRDIQEDAKMGRLYVPQEELRKAGIPVAPAKQVVAHPVFPLVYMSMASFAFHRFEQAENQLLYTDSEKLRPALVMMETYRVLLKKLYKRGWDPAEKKKISVSWPEKIWLSWYYG